MIEEKRKKSAGWCEMHAGILCPVTDPDRKEYLLAC